MLFRHATCLDCFSWKKNILLLQLYLLLCYAQGWINPDTPRIYFTLLNKLSNDDAVVETHQYMEKNLLLPDRNFKIQYHMHRVSGYVGCWDGRKSSSSLSFSPSVCVGIIPLCYSITWMLKGILSRYGIMVVYCTTVATYRTVAKREICGYLFLYGYTYVRTYMAVYKTNIVISLTTKPML